MDKYLKLLEEMLSPRRVHHSICVANEAEKLARLKGVAVQSAKLAGLLHDICKEMSYEDQLQYINDRDILLDVQTMDNPQVWHGITASIYLEETLGIRDPDILGAVRYHTTGKAEMTTLEEIVFMADYTSEDRSYPDLDIVRREVHHDWEKGIVEGFKFGIKTAIEKGKPLIADSVNGYNFYVDKIKKRG